jgi:broad specificity phosphatase PhoE
VSVELVFETHSISVDNERGIATGWLDGRLSERGRELARELGERRRAAGVAAVFTSDLGRAVETAELAFAGSGIPVHRDARLRECDYGDWNGMPVALPEAEWARRIDRPFPDGESYRDAVDRVRAFLDDLVSTHDGDRVVVIGHSATRWALDHLLNGAALEDLVDAPFAWQEGWLYHAGENLGSTAGP